MACLIHRDRYRGAIIGTLGSIGMLGCNDFDINSEEGREVAWRGVCNDVDIDLTRLFRSHPPTRSPRCSVLRASALVCVQIGAFSPNWDRFTLCSVFRAD